MYGQSSLRENHLNYFHHIFDLFKPFISKEYKIKSRFFLDKRTNKTYSSVLFATLTLPYFTFYRELFYNIYFDLLPYYAILRSIPNKLLGVLAMFGSLLILLVLPLTDLSRIRGSSFRPAMKLAFWFFVVDFFILMWIGSQHPNSPYVEIGQIATAFYFSWFIIIVPFIGILENTLMDVATAKISRPVAS